MSRRSVLFTAAALGTCLAPSSAAAALPGTNGLVYFVASAYDASAKRTGFLKPGDVFSIDPSAPGSIVRLKRSAAPEFNPVASPDGTYLLYSTHRPKAGDSALELRDLIRGTSQTAIIADEIRGATWSPDATQLLFSSTLFGIYTVSSTTSEKPKLLIPVTSRTTVETPTVTPDGVQLLYTRWVYSKRGVAVRSELWAAARDGSARHKVLGGSGDLQYPQEPDVSPDGTRVAFVSETDAANTRSSIFTARLDGTDVRALATAPAKQYFNHVSWAPQGNALVVARYGRSPKTGSELETIDAATGAVTTLYRLRRGDLNEPSWSARPGGTPAR